MDGSTNSVWTTDSGRGNHRDEEKGVSFARTVTALQSSALPTMAEDSKPRGPTWNKTGAIQVVRQSPAACPYTQGLVQNDQCKLLTPTAPRNVPRR